jgi:iron(III) transport system substrate-binding protein
MAGDLPMTKHLFILFLLVGLTGCLSPQSNEVVVYSALDAEFSQPILDDFERTTGVKPLAKFDAESTKTLGLTQAIIAEGQRPRCDVFWNNEILNTLRLEKRGLLAVYKPKLADSYPAMYRSTEHLWHGFAARARVIIVNTDLVPENERPRSIYDLSDEKWSGRCGLAKPLFGTTATHVACLFAHLGDDKAKELLQSMKDKGVRIYSGNKQVATAVSAGELAFGLTDTDDAMIEVEAARPVAIIYPDQQEGGMGTLFIPNTLAIIRGAPNEAEAKKLVDYLLTPEVEIKLAKGPSAQIPLSTSVDLPLRVETPNTIRAMQVDFDAAAEKWDTAARFARDLFATAE